MHTIIKFFLRFLLLPIILLSLYLWACSMLPVSWIAPIIESKTPLKIEDPDGSISNGQITLHHPKIPHPLKTQWFFSIKNLKQVEFNFALQYLSSSSQGILKINPLDTSKVDLLIDKSTLYGSDLPKKNDSLTFDSIQIENLTLEMKNKQFVNWSGSAQTKDVSINHFQVALNKELQFRIPEVTHEFSEKLSIQSYSEFNATKMHLATAQLTPKSMEIEIFNTLLYFYKNKDFFENLLIQKMLHKNATDTLISSSIPLKKSLVGTQ